MTAFTVAAQGRVREDFANTHLLNARLCAVRAHDVERSSAGKALGPFFDEIRADVAASILSSVASLEAFVNEVVFGSDELFGHQSTDMVRMTIELMERHPLLKKLEILTVLNGKPKPDMGKRPGQDVSALVELRNGLVHFRPEWMEKQQRHAKLGERLRNKFGLSPFFDYNEPLFPRACMSYGCAKWAVESVRDFVLEVADANGWPCAFRKLGQLFELP